MELIDKAVVVAEVDKFINSLRKSCNPNPLETMIECLADAQIEALSIVKESIEGINAKDVDLEEEIDTYFDNYEIASKEDCYLTHEQACAFAEHFFELGLKARKVD